jgi:regulator of RNase E activity RraA
MGKVGLRAFAADFERDEALVELLTGLRATDLSDAMSKAGTMSGIVCRNVRPTPMVGFAVTVSAPVGGFDLVKVGLEQCRPGDVLVVSVRGDTTNAVWGGNLSLGAQRRGLVGFVVDGAVRDVEEFSDLNFPVYARATVVSSHPVVLPIGEVNVPVAVGGVVVHPGDLVVGDGDGVVVVRPQDVQDVVAATREVLAGHARVRPVLEAGDTTSYEVIAARLLAAGLEVPPSPVRS